MIHPIITSTEKGYATPSITPNYTHQVTEFPTMDGDSESMTISDPLRLGEMRQDKRNDRWCHKYKEAMGLQEFFFTPIRKLKLVDYEDSPEVKTKAVVEKIASPSRLDRFLVSGD